MEKIMKLNTQSLIRIALATACIALGAQLKFPSPLSGYFTLQLPMVLITGIILGPRDGVFAVLVYLTGGLIGIPWFASGGGIGYFLQPTFGFLLAFIGAAWCAGYGSKNQTWLKCLLFSTLATLCVWIVGMLYYTGINVFYLGKSNSFIAALWSILSMDLVFDLVLTYTAASVGLRVKKQIGA
jgi:biotin transport system substrate-specific component